MQKLVVGMKVRYLQQPEWGIGHLLALVEENTRAHVNFPGREGEPIVVSTKGGSLVPVQLKPGDHVRTKKGRSGVVTGEEEGGRGLRRYLFKYDDDGTEDEAPESELLVSAPKPDLITLLKQGRVGDIKSFLTRRQALMLDDERRCDALGALFASRVMVKPHQIGVVQRVLSARRPRFVLADEVGLGKTIEAGMIFSALRLSGLANRVLIVAPSHLAVQWLVELFHKFNQLFTLMDTERFEQSLKEAPDQNPWARFPRIITSLEMLARNEEHRDLVSVKESYWDLVIFDEAHHLKGANAFLAAKGLAANSWGLLLLTATPMQLDPAEYHGLLQLIDPKTAPTLKGFEERLKRQEELSAAVRALLEGGKADKALEKLAARFPDDPILAEKKDSKELLNHLAETYSLSDRLIRNRRVIVGGFSERVLHRHQVQLTAPEKKARDSAMAQVKKAKGLSGAVLSNLLRRLESSPAAFQAALASAKALSDAEDFKLPDRDSKFNVCLSVLAGIWAKEPSAKVLCFTEARDTLEMLRSELSKENIEALGYHGELAMVERDRQVARFRDPDGPKLLICTEVGGEGRNFQFAHHLVNYDLPWSPATMEQRIGRLDRIGQNSAVQIHVFDSKGTLSSDVLSILADAVGVFGETVGGLDAVLEEVEPRLTELALLSEKDRAAYSKQLKAKVQAARDHVRRAYDPLLDLRSFDREAVEELVRNAHVRLGIDEEEEEVELQEGLLSLSRDLEERLEDSVVELARKVGIGVDTDEQVEAFQTAFHLGHGLNVEALPGLSIEQERTVLGSFWRDTAVEREEIEYFATGHPLVESLFGFLRDGPYGKNGARYLEKRGPFKARGIEFLFHIVPPEPEDTSLGARVPSRQLSRFMNKWLLQSVVALGSDGKTPKADATLKEILEGEGRSLKGDELRMGFPGIDSFVDPAVVVATKDAEAQVLKLAAVARKLIEKEREATLQRMKLALTHQRMDAKVIDAQLKDEAAHYDAILKALGGLRVSLDSACAFIVNR